MLYQLPTGKVIEISTEQYLEMTDEELEYLIAYNYGEVQEDPWFGSVLLNKEITSNPIEIINEGNLPEIPDVSENNKLLDLDVDYDDIIS
jgi:hypothetical protein